MKKIFCSLLCAIVHLHDLKIRNRNYQIKHRHSITGCFIKINTATFIMGPTLESRNKTGTPAFFPDFRRHFWSTLYLFISVAKYMYLRLQSGKNEKVNPIKLKGSLTSFFGNRQSCWSFFISHFRKSLARVPLFFKFTRARFMPSLKIIDRDFFYYLYLFFIVGANKSRHHAPFVILGRFLV